MKFLGKSNFPKGNGFPKGKDWSVSLTMLLPRRRLLRSSPSVILPGRAGVNPWELANYRPKKADYISYIPVFVKGGDHPLILGELA